MSALCPPCVWEDHWRCKRTPECECWCQEHPAMQPTFEVGDPVELPADWIEDGDPGGVVLSYEQMWPPADNAWDGWVFKTEEVTLTVAGWGALAALVVSAAFLLAVAIDFLLARTGWVRGGAAIAIGATAGLWVLRERGEL